MKSTNFKSLILLTGLLLISNTVFAYELHGSLQRDNSVTLRDNQGRVYYGYAEDEGDGTLDITVHDDSGIVYSGIATLDGGGRYILDLDNDNGGNATGILEEN